MLLGWTLVYEMFFYVCFALAIWIGGRRSTPVMVLLIGSLGALVLVGRLFSLPGPAAIYADPLLLEFLFGVGVALLWNRTPALPAAVSWSLAIISVLALVLLPDESDAVRVLRFGLPSAVLLFALVKAPVPASPSLHQLGDISYSLYLSHFFAQSAYLKLWQGLHLGGSIVDYAIFMVIGIFVSLLTGYLCWRFFEKPASAWAKRILVGQPAKPHAPNEPTIVRSAG